MSTVDPYDISLFPTNIIRVLRDHILPLSSVNNFYARPLRPEDPHASVGAVAGTWTPQEQRLALADPMVSQYNLAIQALSKAADEQSGIAHHTILGKNIRHMLYRNDPFQVALSSLSETVFGIKERVQRWGIRVQRFRSNEIQGQWVYLSTLEFWVETESTTV